MTPHLVLAVVGVSAGAGSMAGAYAALWWRDRVPFGIRALVRRMFIHVDDLTGATKTENQIRAGKRFNAQRPIWRGGLGRNLGRLWADAWWPMPPQAGGTTTRPHIKRMGQYVRLGFSRPKRLFHPYQIWDIAWVEVTWTSEAAALAGNFAENVGRKVAQALRLGSVDQLEWTVDYDAGCIAYRRKPAAQQRDVPTHVPTREPIGG